MARAKTSEQSRARSKAAMIEELARGVGNLQEFLAQVEDLGREGFPYLDAGRARTELQFRECIRRTFGEKSPEFQEHRHHKLLMDSPEETQQSISLIRTLIATLEQKKQDLQGGPSIQQIPQAPPASPISTRPQMTLVPASLPMVHMTITPPAPVMPPPMIMSVAMTTNLDLSSGNATPSPPPLPSVAPSPSATSREMEQPSSSLSVQTPTATSNTPSQSEARPAPVPLHQPPQIPETFAATASRASGPPQPSGREPESIIDPTPSAKPEHQMQEASPVSTPPQYPSIPIGSTLHQEPIPQPRQSELNLVERVKTLCCRFHSVARQLRLRGEYRATLSVEDEVDAQDLLHALLRVQFDNIDTDEWTPSYSSGVPRTAFLLNESRCVVIVKKTRPGLAVKDLTDELRIDAVRYRSHGRCITLLCFIYDPDGRIGNPQGLEASLKSVNDSFVIEALVVPK
jgi:hypothetical protein